MNEKTQEEFEVKARNRIDEYVKAREYAEKYFLLHKYDEEISVATVAGDVDRLAQVLAERQPLYDELYPWHAEQKPVSLWGRVKELFRDYCN